MSKHKPIDETVVLPKAIRDAAKRAEEAHAASYSKPAAEPAPAPAEAAPEVAAEPAPQDSPTKDQPPPPAPAAAAEPPLTPDPAPAPAPAPESNNWEKAFKSMKGRHQKAEQTIGAMREQINELRATIESMNQAAPRRAKEDEVAIEKLITDKDLEDYGPDLLKVVGNKAKEELNPILVKLQRRIDELEGRVGTATQEVSKSAKTRMLNELDSLVPTWRQLDTDQRFIDWLALPEKYSRVIRHELLAKAYQQNDAATVAAFFQGFLSEAAEAPDETLEPQPPARTPPAPKVSLEALAAPGRAKSTAAPAPAEKPTISRAQISQFYAEKNRGSYSDEEAKRLEAMIFEAQRDGRIIN